MTAHELKQICQAAVQRSQVEQERPLDMSVTEKGNPARRSSFWDTRSATESS